MLYAVQELRLLVAKVVRQFSSETLSLD
jgi:hypothetical protein